MPSGGAGRLDIAELDRYVQKFFSKGLAESTQRTYGAGQRRYLAFCEAGQLEPLPASEAVLCRFAAYLAKSGLRFRTIKVYMSAVRFLHIAEDHGDPFLPNLQRLHYTLQGVKRAEAEAGTEKQERLPISPNILRTIKRVWEEAPPHSDKTMLWAACCLGFLGLLRTGEMTAPSERTFDPSCHLSVQDIAVDNPENTQVLRVTIKQSKTDPFRKGIDLYLGKTAADLCPVRAVLNYLVVRGRRRQGPLFLLILQMARISLGCAWSRH